MPERLTEGQIQQMLKDVAFVEGLGDTMPATVKDLCLHIKALDREIYALADQLSDCWLFIDDLARSEKGSPVGDVPLFAKLAAQRLLMQQKAPGYTTLPGWKKGDSR